MLKEFRFLFNLVLGLTGSWINGTLQYILPCQLVWIFTLSGSFIGTDEDTYQDSQQWSTWTERLISRLHLRMDFFGLFPTDKCSCTQFPDRSRCFCLLAELVHWSCSSKFMYPLMNFVYQGMVVKVELTAKFCLYCFERFRLQTIRNTIMFLIIYYKSFFTSFLKAFDW